jgi:hypothetical protein
MVKPTVIGLGYADALAFYVSIQHECRRIGCVVLLKT